jgi:radical SAM protein (TIGR04043 family)
MNRALPIAPTRLPPRRRLEVLSELQAFGVRWTQPGGPGLSRSGGAGPSDHKAVTLDGETVMVPIFTHGAAQSPYEATVDAGGGFATLTRDGTALGRLGFPKVPKFYARTTADGVPYWKIARLHGDDVLATTVLQTCTRYGHRETSCQFCAIGQSLASKSTIAEKTPAQLAEVAEAAVDLDAVAHMVMTTGTPRTPDRGAATLTRCAAAIKARVALPLQAQCEPPADLDWIDRMAASGVDSLGMHLEAVTEPVRKRIMPGKAEVPVAEYMQAFERAVAAFGRGQVSTYILAGLGDPAEAVLATCRDLVAMGVYPFVVPFVPIAGTPLERHPSPAPELLESILQPLSKLLTESGLASQHVKAGCARCGACSSLRARENADA